MEQAAQLTRGNAAGGDGIRTEVIEGAPGEGPQHCGVMQNFAAHILDGTPLLAPVSDGINGVRLANGAQLSSWLGKTVDMPVDEDQYMEELNKHLAAIKNHVALDVEGLAKEAGAPAQAANMVLLGAAIPMLGIDHDKMIAGVRRVFARKGEAVVESNVAAVEAGYRNGIKL